MPKPAAGTALDPAHPLYASLVAAYGILESSGTTLADSKGGNTATLPGAGAAIVPGAGSPLLDFTAATAGATFASPITIPINTSFYVAWGGTPANTNCMVCGDNAFTSTFLPWIDSASTMSFRGNNFTAGFGQFTGLAGLTSRHDYVLAFVFAAGVYTSTLYQDGVAVGSGSTGAGGSVATIRCLGNGYTGSTFGYVGTIEYLYYGAGHDLTAGEAAALHADPYAIFAVASDTTPPVVASAGVNAAGTTLTVQFTEAGSPPVRPASGVTGFVLKAGGVSTGPLTATAVAGTTLTATTGRTIHAGETLTLDYAPGNVTDSAGTPNSMAGFAGTSVTNSSTQTVTATVTEQNLPANHLGNLTVHAVGTGTAWTSSTTWTASGVAGWSVASRTFVDATHSTITLAPPTAATPPAGATGTLTLTEGVTGSTAPTTTVGTPTLAIAPSSGTTGTAPSLALTGSHTLWASETPAGLFTVTGGTGASLATPTAITNTGATDVLTVGSAAGTLTIRDRSTGATATFAASAAVTSLTYDLTDPAIHGHYVQIEGGMVLGNNAGVTSWSSAWVDAAVRVRATTGAIEVYSYLNGAPVRLTVDGVDGPSPAVLASSSAWGWATIVTGLDATAEHEYLLSWGSTAFAAKLRTTGGTGLNTAALAVRPVLAGYGDSITAGDNYGTPVDSTASWLHLAGVTLNHQVVNRGVHSSTVHGGGDSRTADITGLVPAPAACVVLYGTNDIAMGVSSAQFTTAYATMLADLVAGVPAMLIVNERLMRLAPGDTSRDAFSAIIAADVAALADTEVVYRSGMYGAYDGSDGVHPRPDKQAALAAAVVADLTPDAPPALACAGSVAPSGQTILFRFADEAGADAMVTGLADDDEVQSIAILGRPTGGTFALSFSGQTTTPIPVIPSPPAAYFQWNATVAAGTYDLAINMFVGGSGSPDVLYELFDGTVGATPLATVHLNQSHNSGAGELTNPTPFADPTLKLYNDGVTPGAPVQWYPLGRFTLPTGALHLRVSTTPPGDGRNYLNTDNLRIATTDGLTVTRVQPATPPATYAPGPSFQQDPQPHQIFGDTSNMVFMQGLGAGGRSLADPAAVRSALEALSSVGSGNATVTGNGDPATPLRVGFVGGLAEQPLPMMTCPDAMIAVARVSAGAIYPTLHINGTPLALPKRWLYWTDGGPLMPTVEFFLPQAAPARTDLNANTYLGNLTNTTGGYWDYAYAPGLGPYGPLATNGDNATPTMTWRLAPLRACTMRVAAIWTPRSDYSTSVTYTVRTYLGGATLGTHTVNQTLAPSGTPDGDGHTFEVLGSYAVPEQDGLVVVQSNGTSTRMIADTLRFERTSPDDSIAILATDVVTATWGAGWATSQAGPAPAQSAPAPVANRVGGTLYPALPTTTTMKIGWNLGSLDGKQSHLCYQDIARHGYYYGGPFTSNPAATVTTNFTFCGGVYDANNLSWASLPNGPWTLLWPGASLITPTASGGGTVTVTSTAANRVDFTTAGDWSSHGAALALTFHSTGGAAGAYTYDIGDVQILPGGSDLVDPPTFRDDFLEVVRGGFTVRHLNSWLAINGNGTDFADFSNDSQPSHAQVQRSARAGFGRIEAWTGGGGLYPLSGAGSGAKSFALKITSVGHPLGTAQLVSLSYAGPAIVLQGAGLPTLNVDLNGRVGTVFVLDADHLILVPAIQVAPGYAMSNVLVDPDPAGFLQMDVGGMMPIADVCELANLTGTIPILPVPFAATDACLDAIGAYLADPAHLDPSLEVWVEVSNEVWNFGPRGPYDVATAGTSIYYNGDGGWYVTYYIHKCQQVWDRIKAAFVAAGADAGRFVRVLDGCIGAFTAELFGEMHGHGYTCDKFAVAPYFANCPSIPRGGNAPTGHFPTLVSSLTAQQHLDMLGIHWTYGGYEGEYPGHRNAMVNLQPDGVTMGYPEFAGVELISYEGGQDRLDLGGGTTLNGPGSTVNGTYLNAARNAHAIKLSPEYYGLQWHRMRVYQDSGCTAFTVFQVAGLDAPDGTAWANFAYTGQLPYAPGDPAQDAIQRDHFDDLPRVKSPSGGMVRDWNARGGVTPTPDFGLAVAGSGTLVRGATTHRTVTLTALDGYAGTVTLATLGLPPGVSVVAFTPPTLTGGATTTANLVLAASGSATLGGFTPSVVGTDSLNDLTHSAAFALMVAASAPIYYPASPAGWASRGSRRGPDPYLTAGTRKAGPGSP